MVGSDKLEKLYKTFLLLASQEGFDLVDFGTVCGVGLIKTLKVCGVTEDGGIQALREMWAQVGQTEAASQPILRAVPGKPAN